MSAPGSNMARPVPEPDEDSAPFWEACGRHELLAQRCDDCGAWRFPPRPMCPGCNSFASSWTALAGRGRVWSWVVAHPPLLPAFAALAPYVVAVVELEEGIRMVGRLIDVEQVAEALPVSVVYEDIEPGVALPAWTADRP